MEEMTRAIIQGKNLRLKTRKYSEDGGKQEQKKHHEMDQPFLNACLHIQSVKDTSLTQIKGSVSSMGQLKLNNNPKTGLIFWYQ
jgi:hypothetical protein